ncbi:chemotaxis protein CheD [Bacillus salitolerans]|uniref:Chemoreceptor glutamine deamidase CheD n=1 Tax=Bacillus salitolerans TaxID=1437434 RepID=A0ABW4LKW7_9BACI
MNEISQVVKVGIADMNIVKPPCVIRTSGLGSCVGVVIYDATNCIAGMVHVMLPDSSLTKGGTINIAKFADTGIEALINLIVKAGGSRQLLKAKMAGGAQMFQFTSGNELMRIGPRNVEAVKSELDKFNIKIVAEDTGGNSGRTIEFNPCNTELTIRTVNQGVSIL